MGQLLRGEADFSINGLTVTPERSQVVDFPFTIDVILATLIVGEGDGSGSLNVLAYLKIFDAEAWVVIGFFLLGFSLVQVSIVKG